MAQRNFGLDLLRCLAIAMVLFNHALSGLFAPYAKELLTGPLGVIFIVDYVSIEWLFVLSGFLIGTMLIRSFDGDGTFWSKASSFWLRRWFRTVPNYYLFLLVNVALVAFSIGPGRFDWKYLVFSQNLAWSEPVPTFFVEAWSLALDEWFYLVIPLLIGLATLLLGASHKTAFVLATALLILLPMAGRYVVEPPTTFKAWDHDIRRTIVLHLDATGWGVMAAVAGRWAPAVWTKGVRAKLAAGIVLMAVGLWLLVGLAMLNGTNRDGDLYAGVFGSADVEWLFLPALHEGFPRLVNVASLTLIGIGTVLALPWVAGLRPFGNASRSFVEHVSNYSYSIYLSHFPLAHLLNHAIRPGPHSLLFHAGLLVSWLLLVVGVSAFVFHLFEKPVSDLRERFTRKVDANPFLGARTADATKADLEPAAP